MRQCLYSLLYHNCVGACPNAVFCEQIVLCIFTGAASQLEMKASYTTSFKCSDGSYALFRGDNLTLVFEYGYSFSEVIILLCTIHLFHAQ